MKALVLSLIIALSGSFAGATCSNSSAGTPFSKEDKLVRNDVRQNQQGKPSNHTAGVVR